MVLWHLANEGSVRTLGRSFVHLVASFDGSFVPTNPPHINHSKKAYRNPEQGMRAVCACEGFVRTLGRSFVHLVASFDGYLVPTIPPHIHHSKKAYRNPEQGMGAVCACEGSVRTLGRSFVHLVASFDGSLVPSIHRTSTTGLALALFVRAITFLPRRGRTCVAPRHVAAI